MLKTNTRVFGAVNTGIVERGFTSPQGPRNAQCGNFNGHLFFYKKKNLELFMKDEKIDPKTQVMISMDCIRRFNCLTTTARVFATFTPERLCAFHQSLHANDRHLNEIVNRGHKLMIDIDKPVEPGESLDDMEAGFEATLEIFTCCLNEFVDDDYVFKREDMFVTTSPKYNDKKQMIKFSRHVILTTPKTHYFSTPADEKYFMEQIFHPYLKRYLKKLDKKETRDKFACLGKFLYYEKDDKLNLCIDFQIYGNSSRNMRMLYSSKGHGKPPPSKRTVSERILLPLPGSDLDQPWLNYLATVVFTKEKTYTKFKFKIPGWAKPRSSNPRYRLTHISKRQRIVFKDGIRTTGQIFGDNLDKQKKYIKKGGEKIREIINVNYSGSFKTNISPPDVTRSSLSYTVCYETNRRDGKRKCLFNHVHDNQNATFTIATNGLIRYRCYGCNKQEEIDSLSNTTTLKHLSN